MSIPLPYTPSADKPYLPRDEALRRLAKHSVDAEGGCRLWTGYRGKSAHGRPQAGRMRVRHATGSEILYVHKVAWWCEHGEYPEWPNLVLSRCKKIHCVSIEHLYTENQREHRRMTVEQVIEARALYWQSFARLNEHQRRSKPPTADMLAADALGMHVETVRNVLMGKSYSTKHWRGRAKTEQQVKAAYTAFKKFAEARKEDSELIWTQEALAKRYKVNIYLIHKMVMGFLYADVPMPEIARKRIQREEQLKRFKELAPKPPRSMPDGTVDFSQPSQWEEKLKMLKERPRRPVRMEGALNNVFTE